MDGPAHITQEPIGPGKTFTYEYTVGQSGTYFYHTHDHLDRQQSLGLYGALIIDPKDPAEDIPADLEYTMQLQEWVKREWLTYPAMPMEGALPNFFTINGKSFPATDTIKMKVGQKLKVRFVGSHTTTIHPIHIPDRMPVTAPRLIVGHRDRCRCSSLISTRWRIMRTAAATRREPVIIE